MKDIKNFIEALRRFDSLETVIAELEVFDADENAEITVDVLTEYLNDEADYANEQDFYPKLRCKSKTVG